ncbi:hypothetical protein CGRA01v4_08634 [Colletotrichum graminicola]|nr:hypothetical protein CGRA01v4_08634 [Colletotrichum graminicola]
MSKRERTGDNEKKLLAYACKAPQVAWKEMREAYLRVGMRCAVTLSIVAPPVSYRRAASPLKGRTARAKPMD